MLDGSARRRPWGIVEIPARRDGWKERTAAETESRSTLWTRIEGHSQFRVSLASQEPDALIAAVFAAADLIGEDLHARIQEGEDAPFVFTQNSSEIDEITFFELLHRVAGIRAVPALRHLIQKLVDTLPSSRDGTSLFSKGEEGIGILGPAARTLAMLDEASLPLLMEYGQRMHREHESFFAQNTIPAIIGAHGWTDAVIDFILRVMQHNFYNALQDWKVLWRNLGMRQGVTSRLTPEEFAERIRRSVALYTIPWDGFDMVVPPQSNAEAIAINKALRVGIAPQEYPRNFEHPMIDKLRQNLADFQDPWLKRLLEVLATPSPSQA